MRTSVRVGAGVALALLVGWLVSTGWWEVATLVAIGAGLGAVMAWAPRPPAYKPVYWSKRDFHLTPVAKRSITLTRKEGE